MKCQSMKLLTVQWKTDKTEKISLFDTDFVEVLLRIALIAMIIPVFIWLIKDGMGLLDNISNSENVDLVKYSIASVCYDEDIEGENLWRWNVDGLIIKKEWLDLILSGKKTLEIRGHDTKKLNEPIYLLESGSHRVRAICKIKSSTLMTYQNWNKYKENACLDMSFVGLNKWYHTAYAWELAEVEPIEDIWHYAHPKGAVIWVKSVCPIDEMQDEKIRYGY